MAAFVDGKVYEKRKVYDRFGLVIKDPPQRYQNSEWLHVSAKIPALRASSSVVTIIARCDDDDDDYDKISHNKKMKLAAPRDRITYFSGSGIIIECEEESVDATYVTTVLTPASPLLRDFEIEVDVALSDVLHLPQATGNFVDHGLGLKLQILIQLNQVFWNSCY
ncbi:uncharacterized protein LOC141659416 isoform X1 [Apium graveolens]|uniref:uncharacterized protein LOC141659416 isoform X1 n=1 Tax=Apium graveolens TaxID=4045 RepID=UPI003D7B5826